jgi:anionic cell wall polymer biosynthesis LytR-Cps2A-Psr (LCP) family protein
VKWPSALKKPLGAALMSALLPGLGQAAAGQRNRAAIVLIPVLAVLGAIGAIVLLYRHSVLDAAFNQEWLTSLLLLDLVALVYHVWAVVDAYAIAGRAQPRQRRGAPSPKKGSAMAGVAVIVFAATIPHAGFAMFDAGWQSQVSCFSALTPCFADKSLRPGETIAMATDQPEVNIDSSANPSASSAGATPTARPATTFDINALPSIISPPEAKNWAADGQLNILLAGVDAGLGGGRNSGLRPDTMIVLHVDIASGRAAMIGVPRNTYCVPLPQAIAVHYATEANGCPAYTWPYMLNWLANEAGWNHPANFPYDQSPDYAYTRAMTATEQAIGTLTGLTIDGFVVINLEGLVTLIDDLGGIDINVPGRIVDYPCGPTGTWASKWRVCDLAPGDPKGSENKIHNGYEVPDDTGAVIDHMIADAAKSGGKQTITWHQGANIAFSILPGVQHMDGDWALAYARSRIYYTDYDRMMRQQLVIKAMRATFDPCTVLPKIPALINHLGSAFWTNLPLTDASRWAGMAKYIVGGNVKTITLDPATTGASYNYIDSTAWAKVKNIVAHSLDSVPAATGSGGPSTGSDGFTC